MASVFRDYVARARMETADAVRGLSRLKKSSDDTSKSVTGLGKTFVVGAKVLDDLIKKNVGASKAIDDLATRSGKANKALDGLATQGSKANKALSDLATQGNSVSTSMGGSGDALVKLATRIVSFTAAVYAARAAYRFFGESLQQGAAVIELERGFESLQSRAGLVADVSFEKLKTASRGLATDMQLLEQANTAVTLGLDPTQFDQVAASAIKLGRSVGLNVVRALDSATIAIGRQSARVLDNLGVVLKADEAYAGLAASLGKTTDQLTFQDKAIFEINAKAAQLGDEALNAGEAYIQLQTALTNNRNEISKNIASNEALRDVLIGVRERIEEIDLEAFAKDLAEIATAGARTAAALLDLANTIGLIGEKQDPLKDFKRTVAELSSAGVHAQNNFRALQNIVDNTADAMMAPSKALDLLEPKLNNLNKTIAVTSAEFKKVEARRKELEAFKDVGSLFGSSEYDVAAKRADELSKELGTLHERRSILVQSYSKEKAELDDLNAKYELAHKTLESVQVQYKGVAGATTEASAATKKLQNELKGLGVQAEQNIAKQQIERAIKAGDSAEFRRLRDQIVEQEFQGRLLGMQKFAKAGDTQAEMEATARKFADAIGINLDSRFEDSLGKFDRTADRSVGRLEKRLAQIDLADLQDALEDAIANQDQAAFNKLSKRLYDAEYSAFIEANEDFADDPRIQAAARKRAEASVEEFTEANIQIAEDLAQQTQDKIADTADFFVDILSSGIEGDFAEALEETLTRAAKNFIALLAAQALITGQINVGAAGQGALSNTLGIDLQDVLQGVDRVKGAQNLFNSASSFFSSGVESAPVLSQAEFFPGAAGSLANSQAFAQGGNIVFQGAAGNTISAGQGVLGSGGSALGSLGTIAGFAGAAYNTIDALKGLGESAEGTGAAIGATGGAIAGGIIGSVVPVLGTAVGAAIGSVIGRVGGGLIGGAFGGTTDVDELRRRSIRGRLQETGLGDDLLFRSSRGTRSLFDSDFNVDFANNDIAAGIIPAVKGLGTLFGGTGKGGDDLTGILANAASEADSLAEAMFNVISIFDQIGISAEDAKNDLAQSFLEGAITLEEFGASLQSINQLSLDVLTPGGGGMLDAFKLLGQTIEEDPAAAMSALRILINEAAEEGITDISELDSFISAFGIDTQGAFKRLSDAGIKSFEDLQNASADQLYLIASVLGPLSEDFQIFFQGIESDAEFAARGMDSLRGAAISMGEAVRNAVNQGISDLSRLEDSRRRTEQNAVNQNAGTPT